MAGIKYTNGIFQVQRVHSQMGRSLVETLIVVAIASILTSAALPQVLSGRRLIRSAAVPREIATQLRFARQQAMSLRTAFTFVYDDSLKQISIINHKAKGAAVLSMAGYPNTAGSVTVLSVPLGVGGIPASEISFGVPSGVTVTSLTDTTTPTALVSNKVTVTFQSDGSVIDANGNALNRALFLYNNKAPKETAFAISVLGLAGRVKAWRYNAATNTYVE